MLYFIALQTTVLNQEVTTGLPIGHNVLLPWIQTHYLKNLKLFSITVKELFEPLALFCFCEKKMTGFCSL